MTFTDAEASGEAEGILGKLTAFLGMAEGEDREKLGTALKTRLDEYEWWTSEDAAGPTQKKRLTRSGTNWEEAVKRFGARSIGF